MCVRWKLIEKIDEGSSLFFKALFLFQKKKQRDEGGELRGRRDEEGRKLEGESEAVAHEGPTGGKSESVALCVLSNPSPSCISIMLIYLQQGPLGNISLTCDYANSLLFAH